ncbi:hypothetical protein AMAG_13530 [Allomyces macrogynus ATCC 38327]|uniref:Uncharacterized protein n=1 Tax=Allomyces macrogynus (strain ATCC 38327) TaxID=578462 RepID=A0A0L0T2E3_ALLM3|nr:hypothetical protein AMAG_13530 [Allomyces macrogynus ATCC 38327]|eukprot:KNE68892.1 hypothetical protein AMAG_13530 [Allomyces macrogynus ATCC 38327]
MRSGSRSRLLRTRSQSLPSLRQSCGFRAAMTSLWATVTADARVGMLLYCSLSILVDSINCLAQTFTPAYPFVAMWPGLYQVRLGAFIPIGGIINLVIVRRVSMLAFSSPERRTWLWRGMLLVFAVEFPANIIVLLQEIYRTNADNAWSTFRIGPILVIINTVYPLSSFLASAYMLHHAFGRRAAHALAATTAATAGASGTLKPVPTSPSSPPPVPVRSASASELPSSSALSRDAEDTVEPAAEAEPSAPSPRPTSTSRASAPAESATTTPTRHTTTTTNGGGGPRASAATEVQESIGASFRLLHISIVVIWSTYLVIHGFAITSPFVRSALSNVLVVFVLALEAALKYLVRGAHRRARRRKGAVVPRHATAVAFFDDASQLETKAEAPGSRSIALGGARSVNALAVMRSTQMLAGMRSLQALGAVPPPSSHALGRGAAEHDGAASPPHMDAARRSPPPPAVGAGPANPVAVLVLSGSLPRPVGVWSGGGGVGNAATASHLTLASHISDLGEQVDSELGYAE